MAKPSLSARFVADEPEMAQLPVVRFTSHQLSLKGEVRSNPTAPSFWSVMHDTCRKPGCLQGCGGQTSRTTPEAPSPACPSSSAVTLPAADPTSATMMLSTIES